MAAGPTSEVLADPAMAPVMGLREAGAMITAQLVGQDGDGLTRFETGGGPLWLPQVRAAPGSVLRLRILAQDVMLAVERPRGISALNVLAGVVEEVRMGDGPGAMLRVRVGDDALLARITRRSVAGLNLVPGTPVFAVLKAVSVAQENVGAGG